MKQPASSALQNRPRGTSVDRPRIAVAAFLGCLLTVLPTVTAADTAAGVAAFDDGDFPAALALLQPEAEAGDTKAQFYLGQLRADGPEALRDLQSAIGWFRQAAQAGHPQAQFQLGMRHSVGLGTDRDLIEAYKWLRLAESNFPTPAPSIFLQTFVGEMSPEEITSAEAAIAAWRAANAAVAGASDAKAAVPTASVSTAPVPAQAPTAEAIRELMAAYDCADIDTKADSDGVLRVAGVLRDDADIAALLTDLDAFSGAPVRTDLLPVGEPNCAVAKFIGAQRPDDVMLTMPQSIFNDGDLIVVDINPSETSRHLYVDYFQLDGTVIHLIPEAVNGPDRIEPGTPLRLGDGSTSGFVWRAAAPFGRELLAVIMSDRQLFEHERPTNEPTTDYLINLQGLVNAAGGGIAADYLTITTAPDEPNP